jgi:hypothetical protein
MPPSPFISTLAARLYNAVKWHERNAISVEGQPNQTDLNLHRKYPIDSQAWPGGQRQDSLGDGLKFYAVHGNT